MLLNALRAIGALLLFVPRGRAVVPILLWATLIGWLGSWSSSGVGDLGGSAFVTNLGHAPLYGVLAVWFILALPRGIGRRDGVPVGTPGVGGWPRIQGAGRWWVLAGVGLFGAADELHQKLGDRGRDFSLLDVLTDLVGAACVLAVVAYIGRDEAGDRGLSIRLAVGFGACLAAAGLATWLSEFFPGVSWL